MLKSINRTVMFLVAAIFTVAGCGQPEAPFDPFDLNAAFLSDDEWCKENFHVEVTQIWPALLEPASSGEELIFLVEGFGCSSFEVPDELPGQRFTFQEAAVIRKSYTLQGSSPQVIVPTFNVRGYSTAGQVLTTIQAQGRPFMLQAN